MLYFYIIFNNTCWGESLFCRLTIAPWCGYAILKARWLERLEEFQFEVVHRKGKAHCNADALSRMPSHSNDDTVDVLPIANVALATY